MRRTCARVSAIAYAGLTRRGPFPSVRAADCLPQGGTTAARPPMYEGGRMHDEVFIFNDLCDLCNIDMRNCAAKIVFLTFPLVLLLLQWQSLKSFVESNVLIATVKKARRKY